MSDPFFFPNITRIPSKADVGDIRENRGSQSKDEKELFSDELSKALKFSSHATQRLQQRNIVMSPELMSKVNSAIDQVAARGVEESLILTPDAAFIVNVPSRTVITALDRDAMKGNVFTNIDGAVIVS